MFCGILAWVLNWYISTGTGNISMGTSNIVMETGILALYNAVVVYINIDNGIYY